MTPYRVVFSPEAEEQLADRYHYIARAASPDVAASYAEAIVAYCESLGADRAPSSASLTISKPS